MPEISGGEFIAKTNPDIQKYIDNSVKQYQQQAVKENPNLNLGSKAGDRVEAHLLRMETVLRDDDADKANRKLEIFKAMVYPKVLIDKNNVPDSYFALQIKIARNRGQAGDLAYQGIKKVSDIPQSERLKAGETIYRDQRKSLDVWFDYMLDSNATYPPWFKYYTLKSVAGLGSYNKETKQFSKRTKNTINIFPDLNREALSFVYDVVVQRHLKGVNEGEPDFQRIVDSANFGKIYAYAIDKVTPASKENKEKIEGQWVKYDKGSDPTPLYESLQGHGTGWCTAGEETARDQLEVGDFYIYYTKDQDGKNTIPRIAIRMEGNQVAEVRGIEFDQNIETNMLNIAQEKYHNLPGGEKFDKRDHNMRLLTQIENKTQNNQQLTEDELRFLYEIDGKIEGFGYNQDPRIREILRDRDMKKDIASIFGYQPNQISLTEKEALSGGIKFHYGDLDLENLTSAKGLILPEVVSGALDLQNLTNAEDLVLPKNVRSSVNLARLESAKNLVLPTNIGKNLNLKYLASTESIVFPETVGGNINLDYLTSIESLVLPKTVGYDVCLFHLTSAKGLILPETTGHGIWLSGLKSAEGLKIPENFKGLFDLSGLRTAKGLNIPSSFRGSLVLTGLRSTEGLKVPKGVYALLGSLDGEKQEEKPF